MHLNFRFRINGISIFHHANKVLEAFDLCVLGIYEETIEEASSNLFCNFGIMNISATFIVPIDLIE